MRASCSWRHGLGWASEGGKYASSPGPSERRVLARPAPPPQQDFRENHEALQALSAQALAGQAPTRRSRKAKRRAAASLPGEIAASRFCNPNLLRRIRAGRDVGPLLQLLKTSLGAGNAVSTSNLQPSLGLSASKSSDEVFIVSTWVWRGKERVAVVPVFAKAGPEGASHTFNNADVSVCRSDELTDLRLQFRVLCVKTGRFWLGEVASSGVSASDAVTDAVQFLGPLHLPASACGPRGEPGGLPPQGKLATHLQSTGAVSVKPQEAIDHAEQHRHHVISREAQVSLETRRASVVWDVPWPIELDTRCLASAMGAGDPFQHWEQ